MSFGGDELLFDLLHPARVSGGKKQLLNIVFVLFLNILVDFFNVFLEAHIEHFVGFI